MNPSSKTLRDHRPRNVRETDTGSASKSGGGGGNTSKSKSKNSATKNIRECACGRGLACVGMTQAFRLLGDPRCYYVELPRYRKNPPAYKYVFRNNLRRAYIRHLVSQNPSLDVEALENTQERRYVALHHFHPAVVKAFYENPLTSGTAQKHKVPISITEHELQELDMNIHQEDRILSISGAPTGGYYFCPGYPQLKAHDDLKVIIKKARARKEKMEQHDHEGNGIFVPENIEISNHAKGKEASKSPMKKQESTSPDKPGARTTQQKPDRFESIAPPLHSPKKTVSSVSLEGQKAVSTMQPPELLDVQHSSGSQDGINVKPLEKADSQNLVGSIVESGAPKTRVETSEVHKIAALHSTKEQIRESTSILNSDMVGSYEHGYKEQFSNIVSEASNSDFDNLWAENVDVIEKVSMDDPHLGNQNNGILGDDDNFENSEKKGDGYSSSDAAHTTTKEKNTRDSDYPWETPKYRRHSEWNQPNKRISSLPAHFIDPNVNTLPVENESHGLSDDEVQKLPTSMSEDSSENQIMKPKDKGTPVEAAAAAQKSAAAISAAALLAMKSIDEIGEYPDKSEMKSIDEKRETQYLSAPASPVVDESRKDPPGRKTMLSKNTVASPARIQLTISESKSFDEIRSQASEDSFGTGAIKLQQSYPGVDPTLRIQVHNDLIAWESKRRSVVSNLLNSHGERWQTLQCILRDGLEEVKFAERFVNGFAKAGIIFADSTQAIYDDKLLDDSGNTVNNSFLQNRLYKKRNSQEYSIEAQDSFAESGQSALLNSILEAQVHLANSFRESSNHIEEEILPELFELRADIQASAREYETKGDSILAELKRSEIELRNIWGKFYFMSPFQHSSFFTFLFQMCLMPW